MRLEGKVAIVVGAGQTPGDTIGNGRAAARLFAREGARVMLVDRRVDSARDTQTEIEAEGGESFSFELEPVDESDVNLPDRYRSSVTESWSFFRATDGRGTCESFST